MAAHAIFTTTPSHHTLLFSSSSNPSNPPVLLSSFRGVSLKLPRQSLSLSASIPEKPFSVLDVTKKAVAVLRGDSKVEGVVTLTQEDDGPTTVNVRITGLTPGPHGFHLHEYGDTTNGCIMIGAHFNPNKMTHGNTFLNSRRSAETTIVDNQIPLSGPNAVVGRALVVHELEDDIGKGGHELSLTTGNAGGRLACRVVGLTPI
ncbi:superoxide dismutase [Cu-Zn], chloroplastic-like [Hibiscus syriacus]|uniref:superoxide dismutase [Cu-Zn], chloroplastic-like n=1 Tax=Hibiscus syriacus TaxID=106335 RepID=UPI0019227E35|nr:superoxide dismutase [Cu-Zn], chloroplastic-like [Hibiscus syriacus]